MAGTAAFISVIPIMAGATAILSPRAGLGMLGFPTPTIPKDQALVDGLLQMYGCRQLAMGLSALGIWYWGTQKALGWSLLCGCIVAGVDGHATKTVLGEGAWYHWGALPVGLGLGLGLIGLI